MTGTTEFRGFLELMPFDVRVVFGPDDTDLVDINVLSIDEAMPEYDWPSTLSALIPVGEAQFNDLRTCLFLLNQARNASVTLCLTVEGLQKVRGGEERFFPIEGVPTKIVNVAWKVSTDGDI